ncbi:MAG TPA: hypothetical protein VMF03_13770 [Steroidobacteraceae bacterium]|nr:hypothetical protein [Steroidobacteraceae bacterium]
MHKKNMLAAMLLVAVAVCPALVAAQNPITCGARPCYERLVDDYLAALVAHDPGRIAFAPDARFVENIKATKIGDGLWKTATAVPTTFKIYVPDPVSGQVGFMGVMQENGKPILLGLRLQVFEGQVIEAEHVIARDLSAQNLANLRVARPVFARVIPEGMRMPRYAIKGIAYSYYDALDFNDGDLSPMARDCERHENGRESSGSRTPPAAGSKPPNYSAMDCTRQFSTGMMAYIDNIDNIRVLAVDPVTGLAFGLSHFHHSMKNHVFPIRGVPGVTQREVNNPAFDLPAAHVFKISGGKIHQIEAMGFLAPYNSPSGW